MANGHCNTPVCSCLRVTVGILFQSLQGVGTPHQLLDGSSISQTFCGSTNFALRLWQRGWCLKGWGQARDILGKWKGARTWNSHRLIFFSFCRSFDHFTTSLQQGLLCDEVAKIMYLLGGTLQTMTVECADVQSAVALESLGGS